MSRGGLEEKLRIPVTLQKQASHDRTDICTVITPSWRATARVTQMAFSLRPRGLNLEDLARKSVRMGPVQKSGCRDSGSRVNRSYF
jgi:hypothetical protein